MKKKTILLLLLVIGITTGCSPKTGTMTCTMKTYPADGITIRSTYVATYKNEIVTKLKTVEKITSEDKNNLEVYQEKIDELYSGYQGIKYYTNTTKIKGNTLTSTTTIQYNKVDTKKLIEADSGNANVIKNGKVQINTLEKLYKQNGCNCKEKG